MLRKVTARFLVFLCLLVLAAPVLWAAEGAPAPASQKEKESYSIGYEVGRSMKTDGVEVNFDRLIQGLQDAIDEKQPRLSTDEMRKLIVDLKKKAQEAQIKKLEEQKVRNAQESEKFLAENKKKDGIKTTESGLQYRVLREGNGVSPKATGEVTVNYRGTLIDGTEFDSSQQGRETDNPAG